MSDTWSDVDRYIAERLVGADEALDAALAASKANDLPPINVAPNQGKMLELIARALNVTTILEIGTLGGYSTIWLARALPSGGRLTTLELSPEYAEIARTNIDRANLDADIDVRVGPAAETMRRMIEDDEGPFDLIFVDADKASYPEYFELSLQLSRSGTLIVADNVVRDGAVIDPGTTDENVKGVQRFMDVVSTDERVDATAVQTVGTKGYDGFALLLVR